MKSFDRSVARCVLAAISLAAPMGLPSLASAQQPPENPPPAGKKEDLSPNAKVLQAAFALGQRVSMIRAQIQMIPTVVIVPDDGNSYLEAIAHWTPKVRFPILIDDGTTQAAEDIARFVRGFGPSKVVRWSIGDKFKPADGEPPVLAGGADAEHHPNELKALAGRAVGRAWAFDKSASDTAPFIEHLKSLNLIPPGIVICNPEDPAWPAGIALAAAHGQPLFWVKAPQGAGGTASKEQADTLVKDVLAAVKSTGLKWEALGDDIDAITLALNVPSKFPRGEGRTPNMATITDIVGRQAFSEFGDKAERWGWASSIFGTHERAAYCAMAAIFLTPTKAWVFDGYKAEGGFKAYAGAPAASFLKDSGKLEVMLDEAPKQGEAQWRERTAAGVHASLIMINSMGNADFFDLAGQRMKPADIPMLTVPAAIHIVHSWSASAVTAHGTVGARWFDHGAFAYYGSVEEPFLQAFVPTPMLAARLSSRFPWAAAVRIENGPIWKLACYGDPLWTLANPGPKHELDAGEKFPLEGAVDIQEGLRDMLTGGKLPEAIRALALLGRDADVVRLVDSTIKDKPAAASADFCAAAIPSVFREGRPDLVIECYARLGDKLSADDYRQDCLWLACRPQVGKPPTARVLDILEKNIRPDNKERDAAEIRVARGRPKGG